jgi:septum formation protein
MTTHSAIYLASQSPRRRDLLKQIGVNFQSLLVRVEPGRTPDVDETALELETPAEYVQRICRAKVEFAWSCVLMRNLRQSPVLAADTVVAVDNKIIGKPRDRKDAVAILHSLSGRKHQVFTAVALKFHERVELRLSTTEVTFAVLSDERIQRYMLTNEAHDKAGAYAIQGAAASFVQRIEGSYSGVVGLPLAETAELLHAFDCMAP